MFLSIVIPVHNEEDSLQELTNRIKEVMEKLDSTFEVIFIDDGSTDGSWKTIKNLKETFNFIKGLHLSRCFGQTAALACGIDRAQGEVIITMDADLQHDPLEIPGFLKKIADGFDIVSGWRKERKDALISRRIPSNIANWMMAKLSGIKIHDFGTTFKAYRKQVIKNIKLYGQLHRFVPVLVDRKNVSIAEIPISNTLRHGGRSHYNLGRVITVFFDLLRINFISRYLSRPLQFFGSAGIFIGCAGFCIMSYLVYLKYAMGLGLLTYRAPLFLLSIFLMLAGLQFLSIGFLGEIIVKFYHESGNFKIYSVEETLD